MGCQQQTVTGYSATYPGDYAVILLPKNWRGDGTVYPIIALHGATGLPMVFTDTNQFGPSSIRLAHLLVEEFGRPVIAPYCGGDQFGNAACTQRIDDAIGYASSSLGCKPGLAWLLGESMGGGEAFSYAKAHPTKVAGVTGLIPLADMNDIWANNRAGVTAEINAAAGGTYSEAVNGPVMNPTNFGAALAGIPIDIWYSSADTVVLPATVTNLISVIGGTALRSTVITGFHGEGAISTITSAQQQSIGEFIRSHCVVAGG